MSKPYFILEFSTLEKAQAGIATYHAMAKAWHTQLGYTVLSGEKAIDHLLRFKFPVVEGQEYGVVIGQINGVDNLNAVGTVLWDEPKQSPDDTYYFSSFSNDSRFPDWKETYTQFKGEPYTEKERPDEWVVIEL